MVAGYLNVKNNTRKQIMKTRSRSQVQKRSDGIINYFLPAYFLGGLIFAAFYGTWLIAIGVGGLSLVAYYLARVFLPDSDLYQYILSAVLGIFMAQYIYQMHGLFEMHFFAFIGSAILITYQNWKLQIPILLVVTIHHAVFGYLQDLGFTKVYFTQLDYFALETFIIHVLLAAIIFFICGLWAYQLKKYSDLEASQAREMERLQNEALIAVQAQKEQLERHVAVLDKAVAQGKFEIASDVTHDIGNAVIGFGTYLTRVTRLQEEQNPQILQNLAQLFTAEKGAVAKVFGEDKAGAIIKVLSGISESQCNHREEITEVISKQMGIIANIQEILHIQRQYIEGYKTQERKPVNLENIINDALALLFVPIDQEAITIRLDIPDNPPLISGDRTKLIQVLVNVLKISIESIGLRAKEKIISLQVLGRDGVVLLEIRDTGKGFDQHGEAQLFQTDNTAKPDSAGLTLYDCQAIIVSHGGTMAMTSEGPGKGTTTLIQFSI
jgi:two-component system sensor histidine kinase/response regulator